MRILWLTTAAALLSSCASHHGSISATDARAILSDSSKRPAELRALHWMRTLRPGSTAESSSHLELIAISAEANFEGTLELIDRESGGRPTDFALYEAFRGLGRSKGQAAVDQVMSEMFDPEEPHAVYDQLSNPLEAVGHGWAERAPVEAETWAWEWKAPHSDHFKTNLLVGILRGLPADSDWRALLKRGDSLVVSPLVDEQGKTIKTLELHDSLYVEAATGRWLATEPNQTLRWMEAYTSNFSHDPLPDAFAIWMRSEPDDCIRWLHQQESAGKLAEGELARRIVYNSFTHISHIKAAVDQLPESKSRDHAYMAIADRKRSKSKTACHPSHQP